MSEYTEHTGQPHPGESPQMEDDFTSPNGEPVANDPEPVDGPAATSERDALGRFGTGIENSCPTGAESPNAEPVESDPEPVDGPAATSERDALGRFGTGIENSCPTGAESHDAEPVANDPEPVDGPAATSERDALGRFGTGIENSCPTGAESPDAKPVEPDPEPVDGPPATSERDALGRFGTGIENSCPTSAEPSQFRGLGHDLDSDEPDSDASYSLLARDLLEVLDSDDDVPGEDELPSSSLTERQLAALPYIAAIPNIRQAARAAGVGKSTIYRWMEDEAFRNEVTRLRDASAEIARLEIKGLMLTAVGVFRDVMHHDDAALRLRAARYVLDFGLQVGEIDELSDKLASLQQVLPPWNPGMSFN